MCAHVVDEMVTDVQSAVAGADVRTRCAEAEIGCSRLQHWIELAENFIRLHLTPSLEGVVPNPLDIVSGERPFDDIKHSAPLRVWLPARHRSYQAANSHI